MPNGPTQSIFKRTLNKGRIAGSEMTALEIKIVFQTHPNVAAEQ